MSGLAAFNTAGAAAAKARLQCRQTLRRRQAEVGVDELSTITAEDILASRVFGGGLAQQK